MLASLMRQPRTALYKYIFVILSGFISQDAHAEATLVLTSSEGHAYRVNCNRNGYVLTSIYPVSRFINGSSGVRVYRGKEIIYLGSSCDSFTNSYGPGKWGWANGGIRVEFSGGEFIGFPKQELFCKRPYFFEGQCGE
jgi:hypothetical protein